MENRKQFTMYESIYKSLQRIRNKKDRADAYDAICAYALYNQEPSLESASDAVAIAFELIRPVLDSARKKAESGKQGGSKPKANRKQTAREKEGEIEKEEEKEIEVEIEKESLFSISAGGELRAGEREASENELASIGIQPGEYTGLPYSVILETVDVAGNLYRKFLPGRKPAAHDYRKVFRYCGGSGRAMLLDYAFEKAALAGKNGDWRYIDGIMDRLFNRGITTEEAARRWDEERPDLDE